MFSKNVERIVHRGALMRSNGIDNRHTLYPPYGASMANFLPQYSIAN